MSERFRGKAVLITGAAGGLGRSMARAFAEEGARVAVADIRDAAGTELAAQIGPSCRFIRLDVSSEDSWESALELVDREFGRLDVLVNNAGFYRPNVQFEEMPLSLWRRHFEVNADGVFLGCQHALRRMREHGGAVVNIGSGMSIVANPMGSAYCASKAAVLMTTRTAAAAGGRYGIRVNAVLPGAVETDMLLGNLKPGEDKGSFLATLAGRGALGRLATEEDVARAVLFLADPANGAITGIYMPVDGGNMPGA